MIGQVIERRMAGQMREGIVLLDAVETRHEGERRVTLFFAPKVEPAQIHPPKGAVLQAEMSVGGAPILVYSAPEGRLAFQTPKGVMDVTPAEAEFTLMEGRDTIAAVRNGEDAATVLTWLSFHADQQCMNGAVILDRARPGTDPEFARALRDGLRESGLDITVILLTSDQPLGYPDAPPEAHPFCVPEAPGKDRMEIPPPSPWDSPLAALSYYEIARHRFLAEARAVANIDVHDLVATGPETIFDSAVAARGGLITLI
ncbi:MAG: glycosyltransferase family 2 protein, partial [Roseovarius sp.]|nr:glycosyltransferase family 2 protein [Roseovarius sp.]